MVGDVLRGVASFQNVGWTQMYAYNGGLGAEPSAGSRAEPLIRGAKPS